MATGSPIKTQRVKPKTYSAIQLYNREEAAAKLKGLVLASCNQSTGSQNKKYVPGKIHLIITLIYTCILDLLTQID